MSTKINIFAGTLGNDKELEKGGKFQNFREKYLLLWKQTCGNEIAHTVSHSVNWTLIYLYYFKLLNWYQKNTLQNISLKLKFYRSKIIRF